MTIKFADKERGLTAEMVRFLFDYDESSGDLISKVNRGKTRVGMIVSHKRESGGYRRVMVKVFYEHYRAHRIIWLWVNGVWPDEEIDHIDGDAWNNRWSNLRAATHTQNHKNLKKMKSNTSGITGVSWDSNRNKFAVGITVNCKIMHLGRYKTLEEAIQVRRQAEIKHFGEFLRK